MKMCLVMILVKKVFIFSKTMIICLLCPLLCGLFFFWKGAKGELSYKVKKDRVLNDLKLCLFLSNSERAGIRTPDNLIKSQVLYHLEHPIYKTKYLCDFKILYARFSTSYSARFLINYSSILPTNFLIVKHFILHILK